MTPRQFFKGLSWLNLEYQPKRYLEPKEHKLFDRNWWRQVQAWDGSAWLAAVQWWIGHRTKMPKVAELYEVTSRMKPLPVPPTAGALPPPIMPDAAMRPIREQVHRASRRGQRLEALHRAIVGQCRRQGLPLGTNEFQEVVRLAYEQAIEQTA